MKFALALLLQVIAGVFVLAGCGPRLTLEEARALCAKQGGFLVVFHTQKLTISGIGPDVASPGDCISPSKFDIAPVAPASPASIPPAPSAPASNKPAAAAN